MISRERELYVIQQNHYCTRLFRQHQEMTSELRSLAKIRTQRTTWRRVWLSLCREPLPGLTIHKLSASSSMNTKVISDFQDPSEAAVCFLGQSKVSFSGTRSQVAAQVLLFLMTGKSGPTSHVKLYSSSVREAWYLLYWELLHEGSRKTSMSKRTGSSTPVIPPQEGYGVVRRHSRIADYLARSTPDSGRSKGNQ